MLYNIRKLKYHIHMDWSMSDLSLLSLLESSYRYKHSRYRARLYGLCMNGDHYAGSCGCTWIWRKLFQLENWDLEIPRDANQVASAADAVQYKHNAYKRRYMPWGNCLARSLKPSHLIDRGVIGLLCLNKLSKGWGDFSQVFGSATFACARQSDRSDEWDLDSFIDTILASRFTTLT